MVPQRFSDFPAPVARRHIFIVAHDARSDPLHLNRYDIKTNGGGLRLQGPGIGPTRASQPLPFAPGDRRNWRHEPTRLTSTNLDNGENRTVSHNQVDLGLATPPVPLQQTHAPLFPQPLERKLFAPLAAVTPVNRYRTVPMSQHSPDSIAQPTAHRSCAKQGLFRINLLYSDH